MLEAMASGVPVVVNQTGMLAEFVEPGRSAVLYDGSESDLARKIIMLAEAPPHRAELAACAKRHSRSSFGPLKQAQKVEALYRKLAS